MMTSSPYLCTAEPSFSLVLAHFRAPPKIHDPYSRAHDVQKKLPCPPLGSVSFPSSVWSCLVRGMFGHG